MMDIILRFLGGLVPPHTADPEKQYRFLLRVGLTLSTLSLGLIAVTVTAFGWVPAWSQGFAMAIDVKGVVQEIRENRAQSIDNQILELRIKHCKAGTDEARQLYWGKISPLMDEYQRLTGSLYRLPACTDL